ncbi:MAG: malate dehydrogenase [Trebouxia sp. A1-2]|nr:MAG: malate dehydrogenase [Trebouxia sp. A1-2]
MISTLYGTLGAATGITQGLIRGAFKPTRVRVDEEELHVTKWVKDNGSCLFLVADQFDQPSAEMAMTAIVGKAMLYTQQKAEPTQFDLVSNSSVQPTRDNQKPTAKDKQAQPTLGKASTCASVALPPTSKKLAGEPPCSLMMSMVAMARPAPFTMHPMLPSRPIRSLGMTAVLLPAASSKQAGALQWIKITYERNTLIYLLSQRYFSAKSSMLVPPSLQPIIIGPAVERSSKIAKYISFVSCIFAARYNVLTGLPPAPVCFVTRT